MIHPDNTRIPMPSMGQNPTPQSGPDKPRPRKKATRNKAILAVVLLSICLVGGGFLLTQNWGGSTAKTNGSNTGGSTITPVLSKPWCAAPGTLATAFAGGSLSNLGPNDVWSAGVQVTHWDGHGWSVSYTPSSQQESLRGIVEIAPDDVWVVGERQTTGMPSHVLTLHWDGTKWKSIASPDLATGGKNALVAVSATAANDVWAVGFTVPLQGPIAPLIEHWNGTKWSVTHLSTTSSLQFTSVKALAHNDAWAVGYAYGTHAGKNFVQPVTEHWNGSKWSSVTNPSLSASGGGNLYSINGDSASDLWAVGSQSNGSAMLTERWDGSKWSIITSPSVQPSNSNWLASVAVSASNNVWAVGRVSGQGGFQPYIQHWDGRQWEVLQDPAGNAGELDSISIVGPQFWVTGLPQASGGHAFIATLCP